KINTVELDVISDSQFLTEKDTLVSPGGTFELGFFEPGSSRNRYVGIWYKKISVQTVVWVANRNRPLNVASSGVLKIVHPGNLVLMNNSTNGMMWSSNTTSTGSATAKLDDTGNLVMTDGDSKKIIWQSFDYPTDTHLPGMMFGRDLLARKDWNLSSWKSSEDPAPGEYTFSVDTHGYPQNILKQGADIIKFRAGPWNGIRFSGASAFNQNTIYTYNMVINKTMAAFTYDLVNSSVVTRFTLMSSGDLQRTVWVEDAKRWQVTVTLPRGDCDFYNNCGAYGSCSTASTEVCLCLDERKFVPRNPKGWNQADWSGGCVRRTRLDCKNGADGFIRYANVKWPDTHTSWYNLSMTLKECAAVCLKNCSCMAYANTNITGKGSGCLLWFDDLKDIRLITDGNGGQDIFVRMASSELGEFVNVCESQKEAMFSFSEVAQSTANFSPDNKLGEGGFGPVYKGVLQGKEIAVKRLSTTSTQGLQEFKNEVICISKLQHRNLVKLLGCSIDGDEKLLVYEYMPNRSLDFFIFDKTKSTLLDWTKRFQIIQGIARGLLYLHQDSRLRIIHRDLKAGNILLDLDMNPKISDFGIAKSFGGNETQANTNTVVDKTQSTRLDWTKRFHIIEGIARGLLYLHQDSRLRIIHRDLKASNILLDLDMNPKISDFGIARSFGGNETQANTDRVVGTYGYMSPEYALDGIFSTKSDVFSFGVLVLEIVSGSRNRGFIHTMHDNNLIGHAWRMYNEGRSMELMDSTLEEPTNSSEVLRSIELGLLCVQQSPEDRPDMSSVVRMLGSEATLQKPKQPAFFTRRTFHVDFSSRSYPTSSTNDLTVTEVVGR
ncbi:hypothetical protein M8C21_007243, partial [Ambrosia artemisiifolia]